MAHYVVRARPIRELFPELRKRLDDGEVRVMRPFGTSLHYSLVNARSEGEGWAIWEEEDYCNPPLDQERTAVLDTYFEDLSVERVDRGEGWERIADLPDLWSGEGDAV